MPDLIVKLFPTSPFRKVETVDKAIELLLKDPKADSLRSVCLCSEHPYKMWSIDKKANRLKSFIPLKNKPAQAHTFAYHLLPRAYIQNASIDVVKTPVIYKKKSITGTQIIPLVMDEFESFDLNTPLDFMVAQALMRERLKNQTNRQSLHDIIPENLEAYARYLSVHNNCIICSGKKHHLWAKFGSYKAVCCDNCGFIWIDPSLNRAGLEKYYQDYIGMRFKDAQKTRQRKAQYEIDRDFIQDFIRKGKVLDVGCSGGFFLDALNDKFEKRGLELDAESVNFARKNYAFGKNIDNISLERAPYPDGSFDLVVMRGVIEHLPDPVSALKKVSRLLKKGGYFFVAATPNAESFCAGLYREKWNQFHPIRHIFYFSAKTLSRLCLKEGLKLAAKDFPYLETPYADVEKDHQEVLQAIQMKQNNQEALMKRSRAFWGNMMNLVYQKAGK